MGKKNKKLVSECYLEKEYGIDHSKVNELALRQLYFVGKLFPHRQICAHCLMNLIEGSKRIVGLGQDYELRELWKQRNPQYAKLIEQLGEDIVWTEVNRNITELPYEPKTYNTGIPVEYGEPGERVGNPKTSKKPTVTVE
jgi:hypothetical protein